MTDLWRRALTFDHRAADEMRRIRNARGVVPGATEQIPTVHGPERTHRRRTVRCDEMTVTEQLTLCLLAPVRANLERMRRAKPVAPSGAGMSDRDLKHRQIEGFQIEFIAAEHSRLRDAVEPGFDEFLVQVR